MKICVIGAGVLGLTIAYELSRRGHEVSLLERERPFAGASHRSFAWINSNNKSPSSYHRLNVLGVQEHVRFQKQFPSEAVWLQMSGNILADFSSSSETNAERLRDAEAEDYPVREVDRGELEALEPAVRWPEDFERALFYPTEGYLDNDIMAAELLTALEHRGVRPERAEATKVVSDEDGTRVHVADGTVDATRDFDRVVIAAGAGAAQLAAASGLTIPLADLSTPSMRSHSLLGLTEPTGLGQQRVVISDRVNVRPRHDGRIWVQVPSVEQRVTEGESPELLQEVQATMEKELAWLFGVTVPVEEVYFSGRSFPEDGLSIIGYLDDAQKVYSAVTHSGMTLAALFGRLVAEELAGEESELLGDFRPSRFAHGVEKSADQSFIGRQ